MAELLRCAYCNATAPTSTTRCTECGARLDASAPSAAGPGSPFERVRRHSGFPEWMRATPRGARRGNRHIVGIVAGLGFAFFATVIVRNIGRSSSPAPVLVPRLFALVGVAIAATSAWRAWRYASAPLSRRVALVVDERSQPLGDSGQVHYATLEFEDGARTELRVPAKLAGPLQRGDAGVAYLKDEELIEFLRVR